MGSKDAPEEF